MSSKDIPLSAGPENTLGVMSSYGVGRFLAEFLTGAFAAVVFKFYETEVGLPSAYAAIAIIIYAIWNAVNDPLLGYFTSKPTFLSKKLGRRFPWILFGTITCSFSFILIFAVPRALDASVNPFPVFLWMVFTTCMYDLLYSVWELNYQSVFPDKFRGTKERLRTAELGTVIGVFGIAGGFVIPPLFFEYGDQGSFYTSAWVTAAIAIFAAMLLLPGVLENKRMIRSYMQKVELEKAEGSAASFFTQMARAFRQKNFLAFILLYFFYQSAAMCMTGSIHYVGDYILPGGSSDTTLIFGGMLIGAVASVPLWGMISKRLKNNQKMLIISALLMALFSFPMTFLKTYTGFTVAMFFWGLSFGGFWLFMPPAMADVIDEVVVNEKKRDDGIYMGFRAFFGRLSYASQAVTFWVIHEVTNFSADPRSPEAIFGIHAHMALVPMAFLIIGVAVFVKMNSLTPEKVKLYRGKLKEMNL